MNLRKKTIAALLIMLISPHNSIKADVPEEIGTAAIGFAIITGGSVLAARATNWMGAKLAEKSPSYFEEQNQRGLEKQRSLQQNKEELFQQFAIREKKLLELNKIFEEKTAECQKKNIPLEASPEMLELAKSFEAQKVQIERTAQNIQAVDEELSKVEQAMQALASAHKQDKAETAMTTVAGTLQLGSEILLKLQQATRPTL